MQIAFPPLLLGRARATGARARASGGGGSAERPTAKRARNSPPGRSHRRQPCLTRLRSRQNTREDMCGTGDFRRFFPSLGFVEGKSGRKKERLEASRCCFSAMNPSPRKFQIFIHYFRTRIWRVKSVLNKGALFI